MQTEIHGRARAMALDELVKQVIQAYLSPVPCKETLRAMFDKAGVPRLKANPFAKRGGGKTYYSVAAVEKVLRQFLPGRLTVETEGGR